MHNNNPRIYVAGHRGMVGGAIVRYLQEKGHTNIVTRTHAELDLTNQLSVRDFFASEKIEQVYLAAAKVGGIHANNTYPADFIYQNLMIEGNVIHEAWRQGVQKLLFLGSSCIYPRLAQQPITETALLTGALEPTNEPYAIAKIAGIKLCESYNRQYGTDFRSVMPTNLYGPGDNYHPENSHVIPGLIYRFHDACVRKASEVVVWGTGNARREFLHVDDMARASVAIMELCADKYRGSTKENQSHINIGTGTDVSIAELAMLIKEVVGFKGKIVFDAEKPDGAPKKLLDVSLSSSLNISSQINLTEGLRQTYVTFLEGLSDKTGR